MDHGPSTRRRKIDLAWSRLDVGNKLGDCLGRYCWIDRHHKGPVTDGSNRCGVSNKIKINLVKKRVRVCFSRNHEKELIAVGGRTDNRLGGDVSRSPRPALDDKRLAEAIR